ncbi:MAG: sugar phosphate nucleotidyltransferase, partial [Calditrichota bacterium]
MKAIIVASGTMDMLEPSRNWVPEMLIPIGNKPVLEYQLEWLYSHGVTDVKIVMRHMPYETRRYVRDGVRWGCKISYAVGREDLNLCSALRYFSDVAEEGLICLPARFLTNLHLEELMAQHRSMNNDVTISVPGSEEDDSPVEELEMASIE